MTGFETSITVLAIICSSAVAAICLLRWNRSTGFKAAVSACFVVFAGLVALLNLSALVATDVSFLRTATLAYVGFATAIVLPVARALGNLTYDAPDEHEDGGARSPLQPTR